MPRTPFTKMCTGIFITLLLCGLSVAESKFIYQKVEDSEFLPLAKNHIRGVATFNEILTQPLNQYIVEIFINNDWKVPIDLNGAKYEAITRDGRVSYFKFEEADFDDPIDSRQLVVNPGNAVTIFCQTAVRNTDVKEIRVKLKNGKKIEFVPYKQ